MVSDMVSHFDVNATTILPTIRRAGITLRDPSGKVP